MADRSNDIYSYTPQGKRQEARQQKRAKAKKHKRRPLWKTILLCFLCLILLVSGSGMIYYYNIIDSFIYKPMGDLIGNKHNSSLHSGETSLDMFTGELLNDPMILNVMIFGEDSGVDSTTDYGRSDTMIMLSIDNRHKKIKITSFMRDMLVNIPTTDEEGNEYGLAKLNAAYSLGGAELSVKTIESNFGVDIDRYAIVNFKTFKSIIDTLGGIDINLTQDEIDYINWQTFINKQSEERHEITAPPGKVHLNGRQALWYARNRGYEDEEHPEFVVAGDDFDRTSRQRNLMRTLMNDFKNATLTDIVKIVSEIGPMVTTNLKKDEITTLVANSLTYLSYDIEEFSLPTGDCYRYSWYNLQSVLEITDMQLLRTKLAKYIFGEETVVSNNKEITTDPPTEAPSYTGYSDTLEDEEEEYEDEYYEDEYYYDEYSY
ncbi:MAG: LCP family protein [Acutalibacteraceae bacterium]|nr:LCP family protein [Acutalibacteraceae bacterium]